MVIQGFGAMLRNSPMFVNLVFSSLVDYLDSKPILELTVKEFLWGYDDKLVKMASNVLPSWIDFSRFGILDRVRTIICYTVGSLINNNNIFLQRSWLDVRLMIIYLTDMYYLLNCHKQLKWRKQITNA